MGFPQEFTVPPSAVVYGVETYEGGEEALGFGAIAMETGPLPIVDYLEPVFQQFAESVRDTVLANLPDGRRARMYRTFMIGNQILSQEPGDLYPLAES